MINFKASKKETLSIHKKKRSPQVYTGREFDFKNLRILHCTEIRSNYM